MKFLLYEGRHGERLLMEVSQENWDYLLRVMEQDNRYTFEDLAEDEVEIEGSYEEGELFVDDGGEIRTIELTE